ncbi:hypothetical protein ACA910_012104 [Epithemia clementina (nom. ined.)]
MGDDATVSTKSVTDSLTFVGQDGEVEHQDFELRPGDSIIGLVVATDKVVPLPLETQSDDDDCNSMSEPRKKHTGRRDSQQFVTQHQFDDVKQDIQQGKQDMEQIFECLDRIDSLLGQLKDMLERYKRIINKTSSIPDSMPNEVVASVVTTGECQSAHHTACASAVTT